MSYCHNCGTCVRESDHFCPECGTKLQLQRKTVAVHGYVVTNLRLLSIRAGVNIDKVRGLIEKFILCRSCQGVNYVLLDVSDYKSSFSEGKSYSLKPEDGWSAHQQLIADSYCYDVDSCGNDVTFLFIIGGHDIIPMPKVGKHCCEREDQIDSDLPYGMLYGKKTEDMLLDRTLFQVPQMLHVGRLPLPSKGIEICDALEAFIDRTIVVGKNGLENFLLYGQVDPHWKRVSSCVADDFIKSGAVSILPSDDETDVFESLTLTPSVNLDRISGFFNPAASFYYFNMHGSNAPQSPCFFGQAMDSRIMTPGISPKEVASTQNANIIITEACYGARFIGYGNEGSMLMSSLCLGSTFLYLGSSRIALGALDTGFNDESSLSNADLIAKTFISSLLKGYSAGQALFLARRSVFESDGICSYASPTTVSEFNLFGDPSLHLFGEDSSVDIVRLQEKGPLYSSNTPVRINVHKLFGSSTVGGTILDQVRLHVDSNFKQIRQMIERHLYSQFNIHTKNLNSIYCCKSPVEESFSYNFVGDNDEVILVELDKYNNIKKVLTEK